MPSVRRTLTGWNKNQTPPVGVVLNEEHWAAPYVWAFWISNAGAGNRILDVSGNGLDIVPVAADGTNIKWQNGGIVATTAADMPRMMTSGKRQSLVMLNGYAQASGLINTNSVWISRRTSARGCGELGSSSNVQVLYITNTLGSFYSFSGYGLSATREYASSCSWRQTGSAETTGCMYRDGVPYGYQTVATINSGVPVAVGYGKNAWNATSQARFVRYGFYLTIPIPDAAAAELSMNPWGLVRLPLRRFYSIPGEAPAAALGISRGRTIETTGRLNRASATGGD